MIDAKAQDRFWSKVVKQANGCWLWTGEITSKGYGRLKIDGKHVRAHRISVELTGCSLNSGMVVDHLCKVRSCVNPLHLRQISNAENVLIGNGPCAANARKTHCVNGHPLSGENLRPGNKRRCKICSKNSYDRYVARRKQIRIEGNGHE